MYCPLKQRQHSHREVWLSFKFNNIVKSIYSSGVIFEFFRRHFILQATSLRHDFNSSLRAIY